MCIYTLIYENRKKSYAILLLNLNTFIYINIRFNSSSTMNFDSESVKYFREVWTKSLRVESFLLLYLCYACQKIYFLFARWVALPGRLVVADGKQLRHTDCCKRILFVGLLVTRENKTLNSFNQKSYKKCKN